MNCPLCGISHMEQKEWRQCPREKEVVCTKCCRQCYSYNKSMHICMFRSNMSTFIKDNKDNPHKIAQEIIRKLRNE